MSEAEAAPLVDLVVEEPAWERVLPDLHQVATVAAGLALDAAGLSRQDCTVSLLACDDERIAALNGEFRGKESPTNVLSWPAFSLAPLHAGARPETPTVVPGGGRTPLGDVAIAFETVVREAESAGLPLKNHVLHLILHGCLHLLGYDHESPEDADLMEGLETRALTGIGLPDPYG